MAVFIFRAPNGGRLEYEVSDEAALGSAAGSDVPLPAELAVAPHHALITRSAVYQVPVLLHLAGERAATRVNGWRVERLHTLRHRDEVRLGTAALDYWELVVRTAAKGSPLLDRRCLVCYDPFAVGQEVITCPRCRSADHHKECWCYLSNCTRDACGYPVQQAMRRGLARWVRFEKFEEDSRQVRESKGCRAGNPRDRGAFAPGDYAAWCPECETLFHAECWLLLASCPECDHDIAGLIRAALTPGLSPAPPTKEPR